MFTALACLCLVSGIAAEKPARVRSKTIQVKSTKDGQEQPVVFYKPSAETIKSMGGKVPLLVTLHTWSRKAGIPREALAACQQRGWAVIGPHYRGPNKRPEACASDLAVQDVLDAVANARKLVPVDDRRIYLMGHSGGGHMTMVMAARAPKLWAGVSAWCGISNLIAWRKQRGDYGKNVEKCCGGVPGASKEVDAQYRKRSPIFSLAAAKGMPVDLNAGLSDRIVPASQSLRAFNVLAEANGHKDKQLTEEQIRGMRRTVPRELAMETVKETGRKQEVLFRRQAGPVRMTVFKGGHVWDVPTAIKWLAKQQKKKTAPKSTGKQ